MYFTCYVVNFNSYKKLQTADTIMQPDQVLIVNTVRLLAGVVPVL